MSSRFHANYPNLESWIYNRFAGLPQNAQVWRAFLRYSELTATQARAALLTCSASPVIDYDVLSNANGEFRGATSPNTVYLDKSICDRFETGGDSGDARMHRLVESTVLHELVHWGDWKDGRDQPGEEGKAFERAAYGADVNRYW